MGEKSPLRYTLNKRERLILNQNEFSYLSRSALNDYVGFFPQGFNLGLWVSEQLHQARRLQGHLVWARSPWGAPGRRLEPQGNLSRGWRPWGSPRRGSERRGRPRRGSEPRGRSGRGWKPRGSLRRGSEAAGSPREGSEVTSRRELLRVWGCERAAAAGRPRAPARQPRPPPTRGITGELTFHLPTERL